MHGLYRRPVAAFMGAQLLFSTSAVGIIEARAIAWEQAQGITDTVELFDGTGRAAWSFEGTRVFARLAASKQVRPTIVERTMLDSLLTVLKGYSAKAIKQGRSGFPMTVRVAEAQLAETDAEYRAIIDELPVTVERSAATDRFGRDGIRSVYLLNGVVRARTFRVSEGDRPNGSMSEEQRGGEFEGPQVEEAKPSYSLDKVQRNLSVDDCQYWDEEEQFLFEGECATQQELDDAMAEVVVTDAEMEAAVAEAEEEYEDWQEICVLYYSEYECGIPQEEIASSNQEAPFEDSADILSDLKESPEQNIVSEGRRPPSCATAATVAAGSAMVYAYMRWRLVAVIATAANPPASALIWGIGAFCTATIGLGIGVANWMSCMQDPM